MNAFALQDIEVVGVSHRRAMLDDSLAGLATLQPRILDGCDGATNIATLFNRAIATSQKDLLLLVCDKTRGTLQHVEKALAYVNDGYGFVGFHAFRWWLAPIDLFVTLGHGFDESFPGGSCSDSDLIMQLCLRNIAYFESRWVPRIDVPSSWSLVDEQRSIAMFYDRYDFDGALVTPRYEPDRTPVVPLGRGCQPAAYRPWRETQTYGWIHEVAECSPIHGVALKDMHP